MKAIKCEMCGSTDVIKQGGVYVCQYCNTKYSVEDAKKLMVEIEGKVDVSGSTVKVDTSDSTDRILQLARRAASEGNTENAAKYYEMVSIARPEDWESCFYSVLYQAFNCKIGEITTAANRVSNNIPNSLRLLESGVPADQRAAHYQQMGRLITVLRKAFENTANNHYLQFSSVPGALSEKNERLHAAYNMEYVIGKGVWDMFRDKDFAYAHISACDTTEAHRLNTLEITNLMAELNPEAMAQTYKKKTTKGAVYSVLYIPLAGVFVGVLFWAKNKLGEDMPSYLSWLCIGGAVVFGIVGVISLFSSLFIKKYSKKEAEKHM